MMLLLIVRLFNVCTEFDYLGPLMFFCLVGCWTFHSGTTANGE